MVPVATMRIQTPEEIKREAGQDAFLGPQLDPGLQITSFTRRPKERSAR